MLYLLSQTKIPVFLPFPPIPLNLLSTLATKILITPVTKLHFIHLCTCDYMYIALHTHTHTHAHTHVRCDHQTKKTDEVYSVAQTKPFNEVASLLCYMLVVGLIC